MNSILLPNLKATADLALKIVPCLKHGDALALAGNLGVGKTTFARALIHALGYSGEVPSPTFSLLQFYETKKFHVYHFDLYRLLHESELDEIGFDDALANGIVLVEWPEKAVRRLPTTTLQMHFQDTAAKRRCDLTPLEDWHKRGFRSEIT